MPSISSDFLSLIGWPIMLITLGMISRAENNSVDFLGSMTPCQWIKAGTLIPPSQVVAFPHLNGGIVIQGKDSLKARYEKINRCFDLF